MSIYHLTSPGIEQSKYLTSDDFESFIFYLIVPRKLLDDELRVGTELYLTRSLRYRMYDTIVGTAVFGDIIGRMPEKGI